MIIKTINNFNFLVIGAGRGGTSLITGLIDSHPNIEMVFELFSVGYLMGTAFINKHPSKPKTVFYDRLNYFIESCKKEFFKYSDKI